MLSGRFLFLWLAAALSAGILLADTLYRCGLPVGDTLWSYVCPWVLAAFSLSVFAVRRRGELACLALFVFFLAIGFIRACLPPFVLLADGHSVWAAHCLTMLCQRLGNIGLPEDTIYLLQAMLLGQRAHLPDSLRGLYQQSGASHILALSGLHLGILFGLFNLCLLRLLQYRWRYGVGFVGLSLMWGYALVVGFPVSLCRASLMMSLMVIAQMRLVGHDTWHTLGFSAFLLLLLSPAMLFDVGFQLSFSAVMGLLLYYRRLVAIGMPRSMWARWLWKAWLISLSAQMGVLPLLLHYFHRISLMGLLFSPLYVSLATLIIYEGVLLLLLPTLIGILRPQLEGMVTIQHSLMTFAVQLPGNEVAGVHFSWGCVVLLYVAGLAILPSLDALQKPRLDVPRYRWAMFFRTWPYLLSALVLIFSAIVYSLSS